MRDVIEDAFIGGDTEIEKRVGEPDLVFERGEVAPPVAGDGGGDRVESIEAEIGAARDVVEKAGVEDVLGSDVVLETEEIVTCPFFPSVGAGGLAFDDGECVLNADRIGKPKAAALDGSREIEARIPVAEVNAFLDVDAGSGIGGAEAPAVVAIGSVEAEDICAGMSVACAEAAGLDFGCTRGVDVEARGELAVHGIADFKAIEKILCFAGTRAGDVQITLIVLSDLGESDEAFCKNVRAGHGDVSNVASGERVALGGILRIDLIGASGDLDLLVNFFGVVYGESEFVGAGLQGESAAADDEEAFLAHFQFVIARREDFAE